MACAMCLFLTTILISEPVNFVICCFPSTFFKIIHKPVKSANEEWGLVRTLISVIYALRSMFSESIGSFENLNMSLSNLNTCKFAHFYSLVNLNCSSAIFVKANNYSFWHKSIYFSFDNVLTFLSVSFSTHLLLLTSHLWRSYQNGLDSSGKVKTFKVYCEKLGGSFEKPMVVPFSA